MKDRNQEYADSNLSDDTQYSLNVNLFAIYDKQGNKVWSHAMDLKTQKGFPLDEYENIKLPLPHPFLSHENTPITRAGLMNSSHGPIFIASTPILHSDRTGPSRGTLIFGRLLEAEKIRRVATQPGLELKLSPYKSAPNGPRLIAMNNKPGRLQHTELKIARYDNLTEVTTTLFSIDGKPSIEMAVSMPPDISNRGLKTLDSITISIFIGGLLLSLLLTYVLNRSVTLPISRITQHLVDIGDKEHLTGKIGLDRSDEIGDLANAFDEMLQRLSDTRKRLFKQSYDTGASEMASGVIRDINKSIQPIRDNIELPLSLLDKSHTSTSATLIHELADQKSGGHRFIEITQQLMDLNNEQSLILAEARSEMRRLRIDIEQLQEVVSDYSKFIEQDTDTGSVTLASLLSNSIKKLSPDDRQALKIDIDPAVYHAAPIAASQNLLGQVINVLISHFLEAAEKVDAAPLNLRITCRTELSQGSAQLHFCFDD
ncbi:MAG: CHASE4 domain-containing protein, partial [Arenimonas sp.]